MNKYLPRIVLVLCSVVAAVNAAPVLQSLSFTPTTVDVTNADQTVTFSARVTDSGTGLNYGFIAWTKGNNNGTVPQTQSGPAASNRTSGTPNDGIYSGTLIIPQGSAPGTYYTIVYLFDNSGNSSNYGYQGAQLPSGGNSTLTLVNGNSTPTPTPSPTSTPIPRPTPPANSGPRWPVGKNVVFEVNLPTNIHYPAQPPERPNPQDGPADGEASYAASVMKQVARWNHWMKDVHVAAVAAAKNTPAGTLGNGKNEIYFDPNYPMPVDYNLAANHAQEFDALGRVDIKTDGAGHIVEADIVLNGKVQWDLFTDGGEGTYDYPQNKNLPRPQWVYTTRYDLGRRILHLLGHALGLQDENLKDPYDANDPDPLLQIMNTKIATMNQVGRASANGVKNDGTDVTTYDEDAVQALYGNPYPAQTDSVTPVSRLVNVSTRMGVGKDDNVLIAGFIIENQNNKQLKVGVRGLGASLGAQGVPGALQDPSLELYDGAGNKIGFNDNWKTTVTGGVITGDQTADIQSSGLAPSSDKEAVIFAALGPGNYTAVERGVGNTTGVGLVEVYQLSNGGAGAGDATDDGAKLLNLSTRGQVLTDANVMIGGMIVQGNTSKKVAVRALGPSLASAGVSGILDNPTLTVYDGSGTAITSNDDWQNSQQIDDITKAGLAPQNSQEATVIAMLAPGNYTAIVSGLNGTTGVGLVEAYDLDPEAQLSR